MARRSSQPTSRVTAREVKSGDVVLIRYPHVPNTRWMLVDEVLTLTTGTPVWIGRWPFGNDAGDSTVHTALDKVYVRKGPDDARRDARRLDDLRWLREEDLV